MPFESLPIDKGTFRVRRPESLVNSPFAEVLENLFIDRSGSNIDRPALANVLTLESNNIVGMTYFGGVHVVVTSDRKQYAVDSNFSVSNITGTLLPGSRRPVFANDGSNLYIAGGAAPLSWAGGNSVSALVSGSPPNCSHIIWTDGILLVNRLVQSEGYKVVQFSEVDDPATWTGTNIFSNVGNPDPTVSLKVANRDVYCIGSETTEIWQNIGAVPVPFVRAYMWNYGTLAPYSAVVADNSLFFVSQYRKIVRFVDRQPVFISDPIDVELRSYGSVSDCIAYQFSHGGTIHVLFLFPSAGRAWSIDLSNQNWTEWTDFSGRVRINALSEGANEILCGDFEKGKIYNLSSDNKTDAGSPFVRRRRFSYRDSGGSIKKNAIRMRVTLNRSGALQYDVDPMVELRWKDAGKGWSRPRQASMGERGTEQKYVEFRRLSSYRLRQYEIRMTDPVEFAMSKVEVEEEAMSS